MLHTLFRLHPEWRRVQAGAGDSAGTQARLLRHLLTRAQHTHFGRQHHFADILRAPDVVAAFQAAVPLHASRLLAPLLARVRQGEGDVLWPGTVRHFAVSSGTASEGVVLPRTAAHLARDARFSIGVGAHYLAQGGRVDVLGGRHLSIPGHVERDPLQPGAVVGEVSGLVAAAAPFPVRRRMAFFADGERAASTWEARLDALARRAALADVRMIAMVPSWSAALFARVRDVYRETHGRTPATMREVWPRLRLLVTGGVARAAYAALLREEIGAGVDFVETYGASEGFFAFEETPESGEMRLHLRNGVFYEFVPESHLNDAQPPRLTAGEVEIGPRYALHVSTMSGLWAYSVGDWVRFTHLSPPRIVVAGRTAGVLDRYGERVYADEAARALDHACRATGARLAHFHVGAQRGEGGRPRHLWVVAFHHPPASSEHFIHHVDRYLTAHNRHYRIRREGDALAPPRLATVAPGAFGRWLETARGRVGAQSKVPQLSEEPEIAAGIMAHSPDARIYTISL